MWSVLCIGILIVSLKLFRAWVDQAFDASIADYMAKLPPPPVIEASDEIIADADAEEVVEIIDPYETYRPLAQRVVQFAAIISAWPYVLALIWNLGIFEKNREPDRHAAAFLGASRQCSSFADC